MSIPFPEVSPVQIPTDLLAYRPVTDITPFTHRSGMTYQALLEALRQYTTVYLTQYLAEEFQGSEDAWEDNLATLIETVNTALADQNTANAAALATTVAEIIAGANVPLNDTTILQVLQSANAASLAYLDARNAIVARKAPKLATQVHSWNPRLHLYNEESPTLATLRQRIARAPLNNTFTLGFIGDSKFAGYGTNGGGAIVDADSLPGQFRRISGAGEGMAFANTFHGAGASGIDTRWSGVTALARDGAKTDGQSLYLRTANGAAANPTATFTTTEMSDGVSVFVWGSGAPSVTVTIDGTAKPPVTITESLNWTKLDFTGLAIGFHVIKVATAVNVSQQFALLGVKNYLTSEKLSVSNAGICSAIADLWRPSGDFTDAFQALAFSGVAGVVLCLGANPNGNTIAAITDVCTGLAGNNVPVLLVVPGILDGYDALRTSLYGLANTLNLALLDLADLTGPHAEAVANGLVFDTLHENAAGYGVEAAAVKAALIG